MTNALLILAALGVAWLWLESLADAIDRAEAAKKRSGGVDTWA